VDRLKRAATGVAAHAIAQDRRFLVSTSKGQAPNLAFGSPETFFTNSVTSLAKFSNLKAEGQRFRPQKHRGKQGCFCGRCWIRGGDLTVGSGTSVAWQMKVILAYLMENG
jgi:hypothetical protein